MQTTSRDFLKSSRLALADDGLQAAYGKATARFQNGRAEAFDAYPEGEALRDHARAVKMQVVEHLDRYLEQFADALEAVGGHIHFAADAAEARAIVLDIARRHDARRVVKSKSMTTEEIELNAALEADGREVVETDLGEYILQLAGETPSHIIAPAIHKTKDDVDRLFAEKHREARGAAPPRERTVDELTREAREMLRERFRRADLGVTGVNFAVAETGTVAIVENEGNARLATSLPRVHVAVMGMEKIVPDLGALGVFLKILARSATGQKMSSYVSLLTGPRKADEEDGPDELHVVVLDNGRSRLLADPDLREALYCIRCGACLNVCPVYRHAGGHSYGSVYSGPIGAVITPSLSSHGDAAQLPFASSLCGACREVCPVRIDLPRLLLEQRRRVVEAPGAAAGGFVERLALRAYVFFMRSPRRYLWAHRVASLAARPFARMGWWRPPGLGGWTATRDLPAPARRTFRERWRAREQHDGA